LSFKKRGTNGTMGQFWNLYNLSLHDMIIKVKRFVIQEKIIKDKRAM